MRYNTPLKSVDPRQMHPKTTFCVERESHALSRYQGFGAGLFRVLWQQHPELRKHFIFLKKDQTDDVWSFCDLGVDSFGIQLDPDCEVICLWNTREGEEIGGWEQDPIQAAMKRLETTYVSRITRQHP